MQSIKIRPKPHAQIATAAMVLMPNYTSRRVKIKIENIERIPKTGRVILALNHTDRYNYWPLQYKFWQDNTCYTATWVKGKYYNSPWIARFMMATNNIPTPSRGYLITKDALNLLGEPPTNELYRLLRSALDSKERDPRILKEAAKDAGIYDQYRRITTTARSMLGYDFNPSRQSYFDAQEALFAGMMKEFIRLNHRAFELNHKVIVFPEGTRSLTLSKGRPGLAQMALQTKATVVPIGCNGSNHIYPANSPFAKTGSVTYRIGEPLTPEGDLAPFQIDEPYIPFTPLAEAQHGEKFAGMTELMMSRIGELLDEEYIPNKDTVNSAVSGSNRFL